MDAWVKVKIVASLRSLRYQSVTLPVDEEKERGDIRTETYGQKTIGNRGMDIVMIFWEGILEGEERGENERESEERGGKNEKKRADSKRRQEMRKGRETERGE